MNPQLPSNSLFQRIGPAFAVLLALTLIAAAGCGTSGPPVITGVVKYKGEAVKIGTITFLTESGKERSGTIGEGQYKVTDTDPGQAKVTIIINELPSGGKKALADAAKYATKESSTLTYTITKGSQTKDFDLQ
jgi:hypothetical protein